jgi:hypothetical protein
MNIINIEPSFVDRERWPLASLPPDDPLVLAEHRRLLDAVDQVHRSARRLGLDPIEQYASLGVRVDAWLRRTGARLIGGRQP